MFSTSGRARALTDAQVHRILQWQRDRKTLVQVAQEHRVSPGTIYTVIRNRGHYKRAVPLTDSELRRVLEWWYNRKSIDEIARQYGVASSTIRKLISTDGRYKRLPPPIASMSLQESKRRAGRGR
jgi:DNA-binding CsgD family transcriptional regulator